VSLEVYMTYIYSVHIDTVIDVSLSTLAAAQHDVEITSRVVLRGNNSGRLTAWWLDCRIRSNAEECKIRARE
jgi:hypothetical protein